MGGSDQFEESDLEYAGRVLNYWLDVEALTPLGAEDDREEDEKDRAVARHVPKQPLPWADPGFAETDVTHSHIVRFGIFGLERYHRDIVAALQVSPAADHDLGPGPPARKFGFSGAFVVDTAGMALPETLKMAPSGMAFQRLVSGTPFDLDEALTMLQSGMAGLYASMVERYAGDTRRTDAEFIETLRQECVRTLTWLAGVPGSVPRAIVRSSRTGWLEPVTKRRVVAGATKVVTERKPRRHTPQPLMVDSFFIDDVRLVLRKVRLDQGGLVLPYVRGVAERIDCTTKEFMRSGCTAATHPAARWPAKHDLSLMQQMAVDTIGCRLRSGGLASVNGPPGTGKTTLLMDIVADVVARRALAMCEFATPARAFTRKRDYQALHASLCDHLIVIASSNNGAVENVTRELPNDEKVDLTLFDGFEYLQAAAQMLLTPPARKAGDGNSSGADENEDEEDDAEEADTSRPPRAWGSISAALGKMAHRGRYVRLMNHTEKDPVTGRLKSTSSNVFELLRRERDTPTVGSWDDERAAFKTAWAEVERLAAEIDALDDDPAAGPDLESVDAEAAAATAGLQLLEAVHATADTEAAEADGAFWRAEQGIQLLETSRPSRVGRLLRRAMASAWDERWDTAVTRRADADGRLTTARVALREAMSNRDTAAERKRLSDAALAAARVREEAKRAARRGVAKRHPGLVTAGDVGRESDAGTRHQMLPGTSATLKEARGRLFVRAMRVHLAFAAGAGPGVFDTSLAQAFEMVGNKGGWREKTDAGKHLWATLAIVTPVVSTTFSSLARCFSNMGMSAIPWLLVDEAGQAVPHHALGAIWRAKRAVMVGDPFQVEPVSGLDRNADDALARRHGVPERLQASRASVQTLGDDANPHGTMTHPLRGEPTWVGFPLRVHRRCVKPMFGISNRLAYEGTMVLPDAKVSEETLLASIRPLLGDSRWIDVPARSSGPGHYIPDQGDVACRIVLTYLDGGFVDKAGLPKLYVISPFRSVADTMRKKLSAMLKARGKPSRKVGRWASASVGTVHTFQGKEMETVLLVLGGASPGAVRWACETPNILNVAVSRAQRRLYVVGDRAQWLDGSTLVAEMDDLQGEPVEEAVMTMNLVPLPEGKPPIRISVA